MKLSDLHYDLPPGSIAQEPARPRDSARLMVHGIAAGTTRHRRVRELDEELAQGDLLVLNDTRVLPARLRARRDTGGAVELLFVAPARPADPRARTWSAMVRPARKLREGEELTIDPRRGTEAGLIARLVRRGVDPDGRGQPFWEVELWDPDEPAAGIATLLERAGRIPLPPYIERETDDPRDARDRELYQTIYAAEPGAVAAPTAGLHFTTELFERLEQRGIERAHLTLHVGPGTFLPITTDDPTQHRMHAERYRLPEATVRAVERCRARGGRVVAVGTTTVRVLESCADARGRLTAGEGETSIFLVPGYSFRVVDALLTNFHLPGSTLLLLVAALAGRTRVLELYTEAIERGYRFYSYGDATLFLP